MEKLKEILDKKGYDYKVENGVLIVNGGYVNLRSLTSMPENVQLGHVEHNPKRTKIDSNFFEK